MTEKELSRVAIIFEEYNSPMQPQFKRLYENLFKSNRFTIKIFATKKTKIEEFGYIGALTRIEKIKRITEIIKSSELCFCKKISLIFSSKRELNTYIRYWPIYKFKPDIAHINIAYQFEKLIPVLGDLKVKTIVSFRGRDINVLPLIDKVWVQKLGIIFHESDVLHFVSNSLKNEAILLGAPINKCITIYGSTKLPELTKRISKNSMNNVINILSIGSAKWEKGFPISLLCLKKLIQKKIMVQYTIIGAGENLSQLKFMSKHLKINNYINFAGLINHEDINEFLKLTDIYLQPSISESMGYSILEAMAAGLPIIATNIGGIPELIENEKTGLLVPPYDPDSLAEAIERLINDPELREKLGSAAREHVQNFFSEKKEVEEWENLFLSLMKN